jgi:hypothetical protein
MTLFLAGFRLNQLGGVMSCISCTIQSHLINTLASEFVAEFLIRVSKLYKYVAYFV